MATAPCSAGAWLGLRGKGEGVGGCRERLADRTPVPNIAKKMAVPGERMGTGRVPGTLPRSSLAL